MTEVLTSAQAHPPRHEIRPQLKSAFVCLRGPGGLETQIPYSAPLHEDFQIIEKNTKVRLKIVGTRVDATEIVSNLAAVFLGGTDYAVQFAIGTIKEDHLGVIE